MRTEEVLDQIGEALDDWEVGPDAMRCGAPDGVARRRSTSSGRPAEVRVLLGVDVLPFIEAMNRTVELLARTDFAKLEKALAALAAVEPDRHHADLSPVMGGGPMTNLVPADQIEQIVGARRHALAHLGRAVSAEQTVYILHSQQCKESGIDLRACTYSKALDDGITGLHEWDGHEDRVVTLQVAHGCLIPDDDGPDDVALLPSENGSSPEQSTP